jgi:hypothetical protein
MKKPRLSRGFRQICSVRRSVFGDDENLLEQPPQTDRVSPPSTRMFCPVM